MPYPTTYPAGAADQHAIDLAGRPCPRLTGPIELARRLAELDEHYIRTQFVELDELAASQEGGTAGVDSRKGAVHHHDRAPSHQP